MYCTYDDWSKRHVGRVSKCGGPIDVLSYTDIGADGVFVYKSVLYYLDVTFPGRLRGTNGGFVKSVPKTGGSITTSHFTRRGV